MVGDETGGQCREARAAGHREIEGQQVGLVGPHFADRRGHVTGFGHDAKLPALAFEHRPDAVADDRVVIGDQHLDGMVDFGRVCTHAANRNRGGAWDHPGRPDRHLQDDKIVTLRPTDAVAARVHHPAVANMIAKSGERAVRGCGCPQRSQVLVAGSSAERRAELIEELAESLPRDTPVCEAEEVWEILEQAPHSHLIVLAEDPGARTADPLVHLLAHRHPRLPIVAVTAAA